jgi:hypothetical protein
MHCCVRRRSLASKPPANVSNSKQKKKSRSRYVNMGLLGAYSEQIAEQCQLGSGLEAKRQQKFFRQVLGQHYLVPTDAK